MRLRSGGKQKCPLAAGIQSCHLRYFVRQSFSGAMDLWL
jgi:hypothetical protein